MQLFHWVNQINDLLLASIVLASCIMLVRRYRSREDRARAKAIQKGIELDQAIRAARAVQLRSYRMTTPPPPPKKTDPFATWNHIPKIAFDLDTQMEFGGSRYHTVYVDPEYAEAAGIQAGVYVTDKREGPEKIGTSDQKRFFFPYDQVIQSPNSTPNDRPAGYAPSYCRFCGSRLQPNDQFCGDCGRSLG